MTPVNGKVETGTGAVVSPESQAIIDASVDAAIDPELIAVRKTADTVKAAPKKSSARLSYEATNPDFRKLKKYLADEQHRLWDIGDELVRLKDKGYKLNSVTSLFTQERSRLSEIHRTARMFPRGTRDLSANFYDYELARKAFAEFGKPLNRTLTKIREEISKRGLNTTRKVMSHFAEQRARKASEANIAKTAQQMRAMTGLINVAHNARFQDVLARVDPHSLKIAHYDPPFGNYDKTSDGEYDGWTSQGRTQCDNCDKQTAWRETVDALTLVTPKLAEGGVVLLWQSGKPIRPELQGAVDDADLEIYAELWWDKGFTKLEDPKGLYSLQNERLFVLKRKGDTLINHAPELPRGNILRYDTLRYSQMNPFKNHMFQKPQDLLEYLIKKHSYEGDLVFDGFGCSGSFCIAAHSLKRNWIYCESQDDADPLKSNYKFGASRIAAALEGTTALASA